MIYETEFKTGLKDIGKNNYIKNETILEILENAGGEHSNLVGYGVYDIEKTKLSWILLDWKIEVIKRPKYLDNLKVKTWGHDMQKVFTYRDFEVYNSKGEICIIGTSKWALMNVETRSLAKLTDEIIDCYKIENKSVFENEKLLKPEIPSEFLSQYSYTVTRRDIDLNGHMHNTYYLDLAYEALPEEIFKERPFNKFRITYKHEIKLGDTVICKYTHINDKHIVVIENGEKIFSVIEIMD